MTEEIIIDLEKAAKKVKEIHKKLGARGLPVEQFDKFIEQLEDDYI